MQETTIFTILTSILGSSAIFAFVQFLIARHDNKNDRFAAVVTEIAGLRKDVNELKGDLDKMAAINARIRILDASDQIRRKTKHSEEYFNQIHDDITLYNHYCDSHPEFKNNRAVHAIENINNEYSRALAENDFL